MRDAFFLQSQCGKCLHHERGTKLVSLKQSIPPIAEGRVVRAPLRTFRIENKALCDFLTCRFGPSQGATTTSLPRTAPLHLLTLLPYQTMTIGRYTSRYQTFLFPSSPGVIPLELPGGSDAGRGIAAGKGNTRLTR